MAEPIQGLPSRAIDSAIDGPTFAFGPDAVPSSPRWGAAALPQPVRDTVHRPGVAAPAAARTRPGAYAGRGHRRTIAGSGAPIDGDGRPNYGAHAPTTGAVAAAASWFIGGKPSKPS